MASVDVHLANGDGQSACFGVVGEDGGDDEADGDCSGGTRLWNDEFGFNLCPVFYEFSAFLVMRYFDGGKASSTDLTPTVMSRFSSRSVSGRTTKTTSYDFPGVTFRD